MSTGTAQLHPNQPLSPSTFVEMTRPHALAVARSMLGPSDDVEDVVQEALLRACVRLDDLRDRANLIAWMGQVTRTVCLNMLRKHRVTLVDPSVAAQRSDESSNVEERVFERFFSGQLSDLLGALPDLYARPMAMHLLEGMTYQAIAEALGVPLGTVKGRIHRGRRMLLRGGSGRAIRQLLDEARTAA